MSKHSIENEIERAKSSVKICKSNVENQNKKLREIHARIANIHNKLDKNESSSQNEHIKIMDIQNRLELLAISQKSLISELESELKIAEDRLQCLTGEHTK